MGAPAADEARTLLDRATVLREPADFDLLVFLARHPRTLLASESLATLLGYELKDIARSLEALLEYGLLQRTQTSAHAARLYVFAVDAPPDWVSPLLTMAGTRTGRLALRQLLVDRSRERSISGRSSHREDGTRAGQRSVVLRMPPDTHGEQRSDPKAR